MPSPEGKNKKGIYRPTPSGGHASDTEQRIAEFSYQNDALADLIVRAWTDTTFGNQLTSGPGRAAAAKAALDDRGTPMESFLCCRMAPVRTRRRDIVCSKSPSY